MADAAFAIFRNALYTVCLVLTVSSYRGVVRPLETRGIEVGLACLPCLAGFPLPA